MDKATFLEMMDQYIDGTLSSTDKFNFEQMLKNDQTLNSEFYLHKSIRQGIIKSARTDLLLELNQIKREINDTDEKMKPLIPRWVLMAVAATFTIIIGVIFLFHPRHFSHPANDWSIEINGKSDENISQGSIVTDSQINLDSRSIYIGKMELKALPKKGNLGGGLKENIHLVLKSSNENEYQFNKDSLFLYVTQDNFKSFNSAVVTLNERRIIEVEIKNNKYLFKPKKDNK
jgi:hypothetical protein